MLIPGYIDYYFVPRLTHNGKTSQNDMIPDAMVS